jgi:hypothetical protein
VNELWVCQRVLLADPLQEVFNGAAGHIAHELLIKHVAGVPVEHHDEKVEYSAYFHVGDIGTITSASEALFNTARFAISRVRRARSAPKGTEYLDQEKS